MPAGDGIIFRYGDYTFDPRPLFTINKENIKTAANTGLATKYSLTLNGFLLPTGIDPISNFKGGLTQVLHSGNELRDAFAQDFNLLYLQCGSDKALISGYPKVLGLDISNSTDNYIRRADYTINLELPTLTGNASEPAGSSGCDPSIQPIGDLGASGLISLTDEFSVEFMDEKMGGSFAFSSLEIGSIPSVFSIQRTLSAQGNPLACGKDSAYNEPWQIAKAYVSANLGLTPEMTGLKGLMCISGMNIANNYRNITVNQLEGTVNATETFIAYTGYPAIEEFEITTDRAPTSPLTNVTINGTIQGLTTIQYTGCGFSAQGRTREQNDLGAPKFSGALVAWSGISGSLYNRANTVYKTMMPDYMSSDVVSQQKWFNHGNLNLRPLSEGIGYNPIGGLITYNLSYDDRPSNYNPKSLMESISYTFNEPNDVFASLVTLGRLKGPILQRIGASGVVTRDISIDAVFGAERANYSGIPAHAWNPYDDFIKGIEQGMRVEFGYAAVCTTDDCMPLVSSFTKTWEPAIGHLAISKSWTIGRC
tara:strand:+ start:813 stop:2420 length:1608 start_codon:yes stop_codon:yes gene_type:complete